MQFGAMSLFHGTKEKADKHKCLLSLNIYNEAEVARTLNLRIDSPVFRLVSPDVMVHCELDKSVSQLRDCPAFGREVFLGITKL